MTGPSEPQPGASPFSVRPASQSSFSLAAGNRTRVVKILEDMLGIIDRTQELTARGQDVHFSTDEWVGRAAMKSLFIDLSSAADKLPAAVRDQHPSIPWRVLSDIRNRIARDYENVRDHILWDTAIGSLPSLRADLESVIAHHAGPLQ